MADINEIKSKIIGTIGTVADATRDVAEKAAEKAKTYAKIAKLSVEINGERDAIKKAYIEIGKLYYDTHKDDPEGFFVQLCDEITVAAENIADKEAEIAMLKAESGGEDPDVEVTFETADAEDSCGCGCGKPAEEPAKNEAGKMPADENRD